jgi:hypothetical protein
LFLWNNEIRGIFVPWVGNFINKTFWVFVLVSWNDICWQAKSGEQGESYPHFPVERHQGP